ncbi:MAG: zinc ribbon domain-containing protein [Acidobacteria bacterium]|nr:zinc ribbon domain-containing protein [Acidobacteriota bacterium]
MPIFEFVCRDCSHRFETIVHGSSRPQCPSCQGRKLEQQLSVFAVRSGKKTPSLSSSPSAPCGTCGDPRGSGSCSMN